MSSKESGVSEAVKVMIYGSLVRLDSLKGANRDALYLEYKEWLNLDRYNELKDEVLYCNFLG